MDVPSAYVNRAGDARNVLIAYVYSVCTSVYAENFCAGIKFLVVPNKLWRTSVYDNVLWTFVQRFPDVPPKWINRITDNSKKSSYVGIRRTNKL